MRLVLSCLVMVMVFAGAAPSRAEQPTVAVFDFSLIDTSPAPPTQAELDRTKMLSDQLRTALASHYRVVDASKLQAGISADSIQGCNGCERDIARKLGAHLAAYGWVQKVSNLILNINLVIEDTDTGKTVKADSVDIRSNTDESWTRGLRFLLKDRLFPEG